MDFYTLLDQVMDLLRSRSRVSYRVLKRQFGLDDDDLEDLKAELIKSQRLAVDEDGEVLVWAGNTGAIPASTPSSSPPAAEADHLVQAGASPRAVSSSPDAERRQLTVLFCDLVDSTALSSQLDPEDLRVVVRAYQEACAKVVACFEGHIAQYLGDGLLVYFGYPQAHEDDAQRAIHAALGIVDAIGTLHARFEADYGVHVAVRLGIHTGPVVVGEMGSGDHHESLALGETPNIAARLEGLAQQGTVIISDDTRRLVAGAFDYDALGVPNLKGVSASIPIFRVRGLSAAASRFEATTTTLTPMIGREVEVDLLMRCWEQVREGEGQVVLLNGPPGIGKSRLLQALCERLLTVAEIGIERGQRGELPPDGIIGQSLPDELVAPGHHMSARHVAELLRVPQACEGHEVVEILPVGPPRIGIGEVGKPRDPRGTSANPLELSRGERRCGGAVDGKRPCCHRDCAP
jgi:class 3 adenylate cyclase